MDMRIYKIHVAKVLILSGKVVSWQSQLHEENTRQNPCYSL